MSDEKETCGCGLDHEHSHDHEENFDDGIELDTITLTFENEDGSEEDVECGVIGIFDVEDNSYIALVVPEDDGEDGDLEDAFYIYAYDEDEDGNPILDVIEDEDEFEKVQDEFENLFLLDEEE